MKRKVYDEPVIEFFLLKGEDIICASGVDADNDVKDLFEPATQSLDYSDPVE